MNFKNFLILGLVILSAVSFTMAYNLKQKNAYFRNKVLEFEHLKKTIDESNFSLPFLKKKWGDQLLSMPNNVYILKSEILLSDEYFSNNRYLLNKSDFYGYEFQFDNSGKLLRFSFYKP